MSSSLIKDRCTRKRNRKGNIEPGCFDYLLERNQPKLLPVPSLEMIFDLSQLCQGLGTYICIKYRCTSIVSYRILILDFKGTLAAVKPCLSINRMAQAS